MIITFRNRHGFGPALKHYKGKARRYRIFNLSSIGCDSAAIERSEPAGPGEQGTPGSALSDSPLYGETLYSFYRRPRGGIFCRAEKFLFLAALRVLFVFRVCSERNAKKCAFGRRDSCRYSGEPTFQSLNKG